jgi:hypothetical protein
MDTLALQHTLLNGIILSLVLGNIILASLMNNVRLFLHDFPKPIRRRCQRSRLARSEIE